MGATSFMDSGTFGTSIANIPATPGRATARSRGDTAVTTRDNKGPVLAVDNPTDTTNMPGPTTTSVGRRGRGPVVDTYVHLSKRVPVGPLLVTTTPPRDFGIFVDEVTPGVVAGASGRFGTPCASTTVVTGGSVLDGGTTVVVTSARRVVERRLTFGFGTDVGGGIGAVNEGRGASGAGASGGLWVGLAVLSTRLE